MITLKNLHLATEQEVFDQVARHLLTQMQVSTDGQTCLYRTKLDDDTILKCAAGCLIGDDEYTEYFDNGNSSWGRLVNDCLVPTNNCVELITTLQGLHDEFEPEEWKYKLHNVATEFNLNTEVLNEF
ncbi:MAG: hypothetical protein KDC67_12565 [Ignavibacteriae bacterium]|nr:hypothetical protein [Ignavibacteriota bacterium]